MRPYIFYVILIFFISENFSQEKIENSWIIECDKFYFPTNDNPTLSIQQSKDVPSAGIEYNCPIINLASLNQQTDFIIETKIKSEDIFGFINVGIIWNYVDKGNYYYFRKTKTLLGDGFIIGQYVNGNNTNPFFFEPKKIKNWQMGSNSFKIQKIGKKTEFYINQNKVWTKKIDYVKSGNKVGINLLAVSGGNMISMNKIEIENYYFINDKNLKTNLLKPSKVSIPEISILTPNISRGFKIVKNKESIYVSGNIKTSNKIKEILINGRKAVVDDDGDFSINMALILGENTFTVKATDIQMNSTTKTFTIKREAEEKETEVVNNNVDQNKSNSLKTGKYYALIIGNNDYKDQAIASLDEPIKDATKLYEVLTSKYAFSPENVTLLKNATYVQMIDAFDKLSNTLTSKDNLLVFYAGHGWWDETKNLGYWLPSNAKKSSTAFWIRNSTISDYMASIKTKHTLLIADACFSGSIFKTRAAFDDASLAINKLNNLTSKTAMTSGNLKEVPDQSVFLKYLVKRLSDNTEKYLPADKLFSSFRIAVMNNSPNAPQFGTIQNAGDEGGEFIFVKKEN